MNTLLPLLLSVTALQGQAVELRIVNEPGLEAVTTHWDGRSVPFVRDGGVWITVIGVDLDVEHGEYPAPLTLSFADGRTRMQDENVRVERKEFPTTELTVESRYVELDDENQSRAARESREISAIYATLTPERLWREAFASPLPGVEGGRNFGHRRVFNGQPRSPHSGADLRAATGTPIQAANRGRVVLAKDLFFSGNAVFLDHGLGVYSVYLHLSDIDVGVGDIV
ncbi:MAG TPA: M23 family metallopeptidase, partial [Gammaproteobacteria bacterium]|nr:M23 family metallopeptidase [Gammaproteobacteria bacterium]